MTGDENGLSIRSRHGLLRDLVPIYSLYQLVPNLVAIGLGIWLGLSIGHVPKGALPIAMLGWVIQFVGRPATMTISKTQAEWLERLLGEQGFYEKSETDGQWRMRNQRWWLRPPHFSIAFSTGDPVTVRATRDVMESLRSSLELLEENGILSPQSAQVSFEPVEPEPLGWRMQAPAAVLGATCVIAWVWYNAAHQFAGMAAWGLSGVALAHGRFDTIILHMFAHGGTAHLTLNMTMLASIGGALTARLGPAPLSWLRFWLLFLLSGMAGAALYLVVHPAGTVPMLGASGALYGLLGLLIRAPVDGTDLLPVQSRRIRRVGWDLVKHNAFLFALLASMAWASGTAGGLAWEAHLGGFLFGLLAGPKLLPRASGAAADIEPTGYPIPQALASTD
ncbi:rhomboid family intramembrane serine protease [Sphingomonas sp. MMS12-HWE2-04]|uniref:rhomboid family intramembrane serine protease n=1 Tax=Sphingomonas sp. MMS12-HWE2-04 TaxID=3234199 RepID=UPI00384AB542